MSEQGETAGAAAEEERAMREHEREAREREPTEREQQPGAGDADQPAPPGNAEQSG